MPILLRSPSRALVRFLRPSLLALAVVGSSARPARAEDRAAFNLRVAAELEKASPEAATAWKQANAARDRRDLAAARDGYARVHALVPSSSHPIRRECQLDLAQDHREHALALCGEALRLERSPQNLASLAFALASPPLGAGDAPRALTLAREAMDAAPDDADVFQTAAQVALAAQDLDLLRRAARTLDRLAPEDPETHVFTTLAALTEGRVDDARRELAAARAHGLPDERYHRLEGVVDEATPMPLRIFSAGWKLALLWCLVFGGLLLAGLGLSRAALGTAGRVPSERDGHARGADAKLRRIYRAVLWMCCAFYYVSIPLVLAVVVLAGGGAIVAMFAVGYVPIKLALIVCVVVVTTLVAVIKSLFAPRVDQEPGAPLDLAEQPELLAVLEEVATKIGTRPVDTVYLTPFADIAVMERGGLRGLLRGTAARSLILGAGVIRGMKVLEFKAILAHEHGHFRNEDTAGGGFALAVRRSLFVMAIGLAKSGAAAWYNPAWWFVRGFHRVFLTISQGASRLQEVLADRWAAHAYGSEAFERGLRHVIGRSVRFDAHVEVTLNEIVKDKRPLMNLYAYRPSDKPNVKQAIEDALAAEPSPFDSHPSPAHRIAWVKALGAPAPEPSPDDARPVWSLFSNREELERQMTDEVRERVRLAHGVAIPKPRVDEREEEPAEASD